MAKKKIALVIDHISISSVDENTVSKAIRNKRISDFEDGMEYYSAIQAACTCIVTEDTDDFFFSSVEVIRSEKFVEKYLV